MTSLHDQLPAFWLFMGAYLHQDWRADHDSTEVAFQDFLQSEPHDALRVPDELRTVLASDLDDSALRELLNQGDRSTSPKPTG